MIEFLVEELSSGRRDIPIVAMVEMEQALMTWFLVGNRNNYSPLLNGRSQSAAPWQVKRAEEYIEASWDQPLTIEVLAAVTGSSARSLFHAFKQSRGYSPMTFLRQVRLQRAWFQLKCSRSRGIGHGRRLRLRIWQSRPFRQVFSRQVR